MRSLGLGGRIRLKAHARDICSQVEGGGLVVVCQRGGPRKEVRASSLTRTALVCSELTLKTLHGSRERASHGFRSAPPEPSYLTKMNIDELPRRCRPFSLTGRGPLKSRTKHNNGMRVPFSLSAHERYCEALGSMDQPSQVHMTRAPLAK